MPYYGDRARFGGFRMMPSAIGGLILINVAIYLLNFTPLGIPLINFGALQPIGDGFRPWQYVTYMFLHDPNGFFHIFFNMLALWMFGMEVENLWGTKRFLTFYFLCGLGAGILHSIVTLILGNAGPTIGASGAIMGVMTAFGLAFPDRIIFVGFFFPLRAKYFVLLYAALDLFYGLKGVDGVAHFAHLGGALTGFLLLKFGGVMNLGGLFDRKPSAAQPRPEPPRSGARIIDVDYRDLRSEPLRRQRAPVMDFGDEQARIDAILDKISTQGYQNLTDEEKAILTDASRRMR